MHLYFFSNAYITDRASGRFDLNKMKKNSHKLGKDLFCRKCLVHGLVRSACI